MKNIAYINNQEFPIQEGETMLQFLRRHQGEEIVPTLCDAPNISPGGSCRVCSVEVAKSGNGKSKIVASCHTQVKSGDRIFPNSKKVNRLRKNIVELVVSDHPLECLTCEVNGNCQLQSVAAKVGITEVRYPVGKNHFDKPKDLSHTFLTSDLSKCINCNLCVRACDEVQGEFVLSMYGRGFESRIIKGLDTSFEASPCVACGACVQACPTSAISDIFHSKSVQPEKTVRTICTYCGVGCNLDVAVQGEHIHSITAPYDADANQGHTCVKGRYAFKFYNHVDRLRNPLIRKNGKLTPATWDEAYDFIAQKLNSIKADSGADAIAGISSARCTNEENYLMQKFIRAVVGTNNIDGCARICHAPTATGMQRAFGTGAATNSIQDLKKTDCMLVVGANPTNAHPVTGAKIKQAAIQGKTLIVIDPRKTGVAEYAHYHLALRPGTNVAVLNMFMYYLVTENLVDEDFLASRCEGYEDFKNQILKLDVEAMEAVSGVDRALVKEAAVAYGAAPAAMSFHGLGVTEHLQGTHAVTLMANLSLLTGNLGKPGAGVNPLRGQNNVQGAADMGVQPNQGAGYLNMDNPESRAHYEKFYNTTLPSGKGLTIPRMFEQALEGNLKALWIMGEDVVQTEPNSMKVIKSLEALDLLIVQELFLSATAAYADVVLPASSFFEKNGTFTNGERRIQKVNQVVPPLEGTKPDGQIVVDIMNRMGYEQPSIYHPKWVLEEIAQVVPFFAGVTWDNLGENGKQWPVLADGTDTQILHQATFKRGKGKIHFVAFEETPELLDNAESFPFILTTNRSLVHYNSGSMTRRTRETEILGEDVLLMNPKDAQRKDIQDGEMVDICSARGCTQIRVQVTDMVKQGVVSTTFHFPDILINKITSDVLDTEADCPEYKVVAVDVRKMGVGIA